MDGLEIDDKTRAALGRLTAAEKECLARRLRHQTAKEMALDLGVSPHAVEKRLKMARAKLGLSSSLEAARLLAASEMPCQRTGPQPADLALALPAGHARPHRQLMWGVPIVILTAAALALVAQMSEGGVAPIDAGGVAPYPASVSSAQQGDARPPTPVLSPEDQAKRVDRTSEPEDLVEATPPEIQVVLRDSFAGADRNRSGYIEPEESPYSGTAEVTFPIFNRDEHGNVTPTGEVRRLSVDQARAEYIGRADDDHDGRIDFQEYRKWMGPIMAERGIPAAWKADMNRPIEQ